ncbi:MAG: GIY-YIG nuclease family protein [Anaerolineae bacterium]|nr:GIY-YIG nuclease family protein [Anaerolineae bacterium]
MLNSNGQSGIYLLQQADTSIFKIGRGDAANRIRQYGAGNDRELIIIKETKKITYGQAVVGEGWLQRLHAVRKVENGGGREWFKLSREQVFDLRRFLTAYPGSLPEYHEAYLTILPELEAEAARREFRPVDIVLRLSPYVELLINRHTKGWSIEGEIISALYGIKDEWFAGLVQKVAENAEGCLQNFFVFRQFDNTSDDETEEISLQ